MMGEPTDSDLLRQHADASWSEAFGLLTRRYGGLVYASAYRQLRDRHQAEDATQAVFLLLARKPHRIDGAHLPAWLLSASRYVCLDLIRKQARRRKHETTAAAMHPQQTTSDAIPALERRDELPRLDEALQRLKRRDRTAVAIRYLQDRPLADVAAALGVTTEAAQKVVSRALVKLQSLLRARGTTLSVDALAVTLAAQAATDPPAALLAGLGQLATAASNAAVIPAPSAAVANGATHMMFLAKLQTACATILVAVATVAGGTVLVQQALAPAAPPPAATPATEGVLRVKAFIDGRSFLKIRGNTVQWYHQEFAAPGRLGGQNRPTVINGKDWLPEWPDLGEENREYQGVSSKYEDLAPPLPAAEVAVSIVPVRVRGKVTVVQQPTPDNQYTATVDFDDGPLGGAADYVVDIRWQTAPPTPQSSPGKN
jgi:RNA polymerase sigma factor (sigma-70 family)